MNIKYIIGILWIGLWSCAADGPETIVTESGLTCELHDVSTDQVKCENGDVIQFHLVVQNHEDSILSNTMTSGGAQTLEVEESIFSGDVMEGLRMLSEGDSASFYVPVDSIFYGAPSLPAYAVSGTKWKYSFKILNHKTREDLRAESQAMAIQHATRIRAEIANNYSQIEEDVKILRAYLKKENIEAEIQPEGFFIAMKNDNQGKMAVPGDKVSVHYTGTLLDGTKFDSSYDRGRPYEFTLGVGEVIFGWDLTFDRISKGSEATIFIPSSLAYGKPGFGGGAIPPNAPLIFDVQLVDIK